MQFTEFGAEEFDRGLTTSLVIEGLIEGQGILRPGHGSLGQQGQHCLVIG